MKKFLALALLLGSFSIAGVDFASVANAQLDTGDGAAVKPSVTVPSTARRSRRSYSVAPDAPRIVPMMRRCTPARVPSYLLPKSDPRKFNGF